MTTRWQCADILSLTHHEGAEVFVTSCLSSLAWQTERNLLPEQPSSPPWVRITGSHCVPCFLKAVPEALLCSTTQELKISRVDLHKDNVTIFSTTGTNGHQHPRMVSVCRGPRTSCPQPSARSTRGTKVSQVATAYFSFQLLLCFWTDMWDRCTHFLRFGVGVDTRIRCVIIKSVAFSVSITPTIYS